MTLALDVPPGLQGYRMPAEWHPHRRCWMTWPADPATFGARHAAAEGEYAAVARAISRCEPVEMIAPPDQCARVRTLCGLGVRVRGLPIQDGWFRDNGPTFVLGAQDALAGIHWRFNGYGGRQPHALDAEVGRLVLQEEGIPRFAAPFVLEGGSIHSDGQGTILTSRECLLNPNRNPSLSQPEIEQALKDWLGAEAVIWLNRGLVDDVTDGHVDNLACFAGPGRVLALSCSDPTDPLSAILAENLDILRSARDARGRTLEVIEVPAPPALYDEARDLRLGASHINFYLANGGLILPQFGLGDADDRAARIIAQAWPTHRPIQVPSLAILYGGGNIHCITQQEPSASPIVESAP